MMPVPVARKALVRIGEAFSAQKLRHPGIAAQQLVAARKTMVRQKITAIGFDRAIDESLKGEPGAVHAGSVMIHMQVEDDADVVSLGPSEKCILVLVDQADGAVDEVDRMSKKILANRRHEPGELRAWHVDLRDHLRTVHLRAQMRVEWAVIVVEIDVDLVRVVPVELACRAEVEVRELRECLALVDVGQVQESPPVSLMKAQLIRWDGTVVVDRAVAGEHAVNEKSWRVGVSSELEVTVNVTVPNARLESPHQDRHGQELDDAFDLLPADQLQADRHHDAEQAVPADDHAEEFRILPA